MGENHLLSLADYYSADAETLLIKYRQIEQLIGRSHHSVSEGSYCEVLLKEFLRRTLPRHVSVDGGFIRRISDTDWSRKQPALPTDAPIATPQLDIIVHDTENYAPLFRSEDFVVVLPDAVRGVIEVKKCLDRSKLSEAVETIGKTTHLLRRWVHQSRLFTGIFAFSLDDGLSPATKVVSDSFRSVYQETLDTFEGDCDLPVLLMALPRLALQQGNPPNQFNYCPTAPEDEDTPNLAGQFLVFLLSYYSSWATQGRVQSYPEAIKKRRKEAFVVKVP